MTGIVGGTVTGSELTSIADALYRENWYETRYAEKKGAGIGLVEHGDRDPRSNTLWEGPSAIGVVHGVVSDGGPYSTAPDELFPAVLSNPMDVLPALEGPFVLACFDTDSDRALLATDKVGSRPCYYTTDGGFSFSSEIKSLLAQQSTHEIDHDAVSDLFLMGWVIGEKTPIQGIRNLPPASVLTYSGDELSVRRYWEPTVDPLPPSGYPSRWINDFRETVGDISATVDDEVTLWLSGGIDSRATAATLEELDADFETLTYRDKKGRDAKFAADVASCLDAENTVLEPTGPEEFVEGIEKSVLATDGMMSWSRFVNLSFTFDELHTRSDVVLEGPTLLGEDVWNYYLRNGTSPTDALFKKKGKLPVEDVKSLLSVPVSPKRSLRAAVHGSGRAADRFQLLDTMRRFYAYSHMRSNIVQRSQVGTRTFSHGSILETTMRMPGEYRMRTIPFSGGTVPYGVPKIKLAVTRRLNHGVDEIPWDRTNVSPAAPFPAHVAGFAFNEIRDTLRSAKTGRYIDWYRDDPTVRTYLDRIVDAACQRPFLCEDAVRTHQRRVLEGESNIIPLASITALEIWLQECVD